MVTFDLLTLKVVSESRVTWATSVPILIICLSVLDLGPTYATDRRQTASSLNAPAYIRGVGIIQHRDTYNITQSRYEYSVWKSNSDVVYVSGQHPEIDFFVSSRRVENNQQQ